MRGDVRHRTTVHRRALAHLVAQLDDARLATSSLCDGWTVRDVLGHLVMSLELGAARFAIEVARDRGRAAATSDRLARAYGARPVGDLVRVLRDRSEAYLSPPGVGPLGPFADACIHTRDVAIPLDLPATAPPEDWVRVLDFLTGRRARAGGFVPRGRFDGLRLVAADQPWASGSGAEVTGSSEALALAVSGRPVALAELDGPGVPTLRQRISPPRR